MNAEKTGDKGVSSRPHRNSADRKIILASASARRRELLKQAGMSFTVRPSDFSEITSSLPPEELVARNAAGKARDVAKHYRNAIIIGADTVGVYRKRILQKPTDSENARRILRSLRGKKHEVYTGLCIIDTETNKEIIEMEKTKVYFAKLSDDEIRGYIETGESIGKAGGYAIQGRGALLIEKIEGSYTNVVGLPLFLLRKIMQRLNFNIL